MSVRAGDDCPVCDRGILRRQSTKTVGLRRTRYLKCNVCGHTAKSISTVDARGRDVDIRSDIKVVDCPRCGCSIHCDA